VKGWYLIVAGSPVDQNDLIVPYLNWSGGFYPTNDLIIKR
jgi:hypothetical protein